eukprot:CAMPEP_0169185002 /NCGR_PEP_ID=MMETSP1016-20121227/1541_1 /TAXON_ID=342587 /ORGANISM="Karlodinium micrum, Strain CCMP2283" /LENGTH=459 /DNA_ID=CAMNT_0009260631 /DNA_START=19 /DNA_END=1395 /DNA_ORIENTATION=+
MQDGTDESDATADEKPVFSFQVSHQATLDSRCSTFSNLTTGNSSPRSLHSTKVKRHQLRTLTRQAAGHAGEIYRESINGVQVASSVSPTIYKKFNQQEYSNYVEIWNGIDDPLQEFVPRLEGIVTVGEDEGDVQETAGSDCIADLIRLQNVTFGFHQPFVMDCKMGCRSFDEKEASSKKARGDLFERLQKLAPEHLTPEELQSRSVTKYKWMCTRDKMSSTYELGFRIDGVAGPDSFRRSPDDFCKICTRDDVEKSLMQILEYPVAIHTQQPSSNNATNLLRVSETRQENMWATHIKIVNQFLSSLRRLRESCEESSFFQTHEFIGASLLFIMDALTLRAGIFLIDFAKTLALPEGISIDHQRRWEPGTHEDGFLMGVDSCIQCWESVLASLEANLDPGLSSLTTCSSGIGCNGLPQNSVTCTDEFPCTSSKDAVDDDKTIHLPAHVQIVPVVVNGESA